MVAIATRASWGARYADGDKTLTGLAAEVFVHHTVSTQLPATATVDQERAQVRAVEQTGQNRFGTGISYNVLIFPSGRAYQGVSWNRRGTHTGGRNSTSRSICFVGNYETNQPTAAQLATAAAIYDEGRGKWWKITAPLRGHCDVSVTACPGKNVFSRLPEIRAGNPGGTPAPAPAPSGLKVDGFWGSATSTRLQQVLGTPADGVVSHQTAAWRSQNPGLTTGWDWTGKAGDGGSQMIAEHQRRLKARGRYAGAIDGKAGPQYFRGLQADLGTPVDGTISEQSRMVMALQRRLNAGTV